MSKKDFWEGYVPEPVKCKYPKCSYPCSDLPDCQDAEKPAQQEPYCYTYTENGEEYFAPPKAYVPDDATPLYTSPPAQRTWVGLTDEEVDDLSREMVKGKKSVNWLSYSIEAKLKARNT